MNPGKLMQADAVVGQQEGASVLAMRLHWWQWPNALSLDAAAIAMSWYALIALSFGQPVAWGNLAVLGLSTWLVYVADHWLDAARSTGDSWRPLRHHIFLCGRGAWLCLWLALLVVDAWVAATVIDHALWQRGAVLTVVVLLYVGAVHAMRWPMPKEWIVSAVFAAAPILMVEHLTMQGFAEWVLFGGLWLVVAANCLLLNQWEAEAGEATMAKMDSPWKATCALATGLALCLFAVGSATYHYLAIALLLSAIALPVLALSGSRLNLPYELRHSLLDFAYGLAVAVPLFVIMWQM